MAAQHCLGKGKLRVTEEKRTPEKVLEVEEGESLVLQERLTVYRVLRYPVCKKV